MTTAVKVAIRHKGKKACPEGGEQICLYIHSELTSFTN